MAECVGKLTLPDPDTLLPKLKVRGGGGEESRGRGVAGQVYMGSMGSGCGWAN